jgi:hypothetical protein
LSTLKIRYNKNKHQREFHTDITSKRLHLSSGFGGGKTYALIMKMIQLSRLNKNIHGGLMCPSYAEFTKDFKPLAEEIFDRNKIPYSYHGQEHYYTFPWTKGKVYVVSARDKIRGPNWGFAVINELTLCPLVRYKEVLGRVRVKRAKYPQVASVGTPEGVASDYYEYMIENPRDNFRIIYGDTRDNIENLSEDYVQDLESDYDSVMQDAYVRGLWVNMTGNRFYYSYKPEVNDDKSIEYNPYSTVHISIDFNVNPLCANLWHYDGKYLMAFDEIHLKDMKEGADTKMLGRAIMAKGHEPDEVILYPDPAGTARSTKGKPDIQQLEEMGFVNIRKKSKAPGMRTRQLNVNNLLEKGIIKINPKTCPQLKKDLLGVEQDLVTLEKVKDKQLQRTHHSDGLDYLTDILFPFSGHKIRSRVERLR